MNTSNPSALVKLHLAVFVAGLTGLFGKLVSLPEVNMVWYRLLFSVLFFVPLLACQGKLHRIPFREIRKLAGVGLLLGVHWMLFYASIRLSNVSIGVVCYALVGFYTAILDPFINHKKFDWRELGFSLLTLAGLLLIFQFDTKFRLGILVGAVSSLMAAIYTMYNKRVCSQLQHSTSTFLVYEMMGGLLCVTLMLPLSPILSTTNAISWIPSLHDLAWLLVLASVCTVGQYLLQLEALRQVSSFTVTLTYNLEPVYSILLAFIFFQEQKELSWAFFGGILLIVLSVCLQNRRIISN